MTRINCVPPTELTRQHLIAEYRELPRVFSLVRAAIDRGEHPVLYPRYTLGKGHVRFFYARLTWVVKRQESLITEMINRGYSPQFGVPTLDKFPPEWCNDWEPDDIAMAINRERISARLEK